MRRGWVRLAVTISVFGFLLCEANGQTLDQQRCAAPDPDVAILGCTAIIQSGHEPEKLVSLAYVSRGIAYSEKGQGDPAIQDFDRAIGLDPNIAIAFCYRGGVYAEKGQYDQAIRDLNEAIRLDQRLALAFFYRGTVHAGNGQDNLAVQDYREANRLDPDYVGKDSYHLSLRKLEQDLSRGAINVYAADKYHDRRIYSYDQIIRINPNDAEAFEGRGKEYGGKGQHDRAVQDFDEAIRLDRKRAEAFYSRAISYRALGRKSEAAADFAEARRLDPQLPPPSW